MNTFCEVCGIEIPKNEAKSGRTTCSLACSKIKRRKPCAVCGELFLPRAAKNRNQKYCSAECRWSDCRSKRQKQNQTTCPVCGKVFSKRKGQETCSISCGVSLSHSRKRYRNSHGMAVCRMCKKKFDTKSGANSTYCSFQCMAKAKEQYKTESHSHSLSFDPWATGMIPPTRYAKDLYRLPDPVLGF